MRKTLQFVVLPIDQGQERYNAPSRKEAGRGLVKTKEGEGEDGGRERAKMKG